MSDNVNPQSPENQNEQGGQIPPESPQTQENNIIGKETIDDNGEMKEARPVKLENIDEKIIEPLDNNKLERLLDVPLTVSVEIGRARMTISELLQLGVGSVIELDKMAGEPVDILINDKIMAKGEVVVIDESFGVRIISLIGHEGKVSSLKGLV